MLSERDLNEAIRECENAPSNYANCEKLATFYTIHDHLYDARPSVQAVDEMVVGGHGESEFLESVRGMKAEDAWGLMDELMSTVRAINPRLYEGVMRKLV